MLARYIAFAAGLAILLGALATDARAQIGSAPAGSQEALSAIAAHNRRMAEAAERTEKLTFNGDVLFGRSPHWSDSTTSQFAGTVRSKAVADYFVGDWGCSFAAFKVLSKVGPDEFLATAGRDEDVVLIRGLDTSKIRDGAQFMLLHPVVIDDTFDYESVLGASHTVLVLNAKSPALIDIADKAKAAKDAKVAAARADAEAKLYRVWSDSSGKFSVRAKFAGLVNRRVKLTKEDGTTIEVPLSKLSVADREFAEKPEVDPFKGEK